MSDDRFRTWIGHCVSPGETISWLAFEAKAKADGYPFLFHEEHEKEGEPYYIRVYKRRPPTVREAGDVMAEVLDGHVAGAEVARPYAEKLANDWREAVVREASE